MIDGASKLKEEAVRETGICSRVAAIWLVLGWCSSALGNSSEPINPLEEKGQYSLLNPTPNDRLRSMDIDRPNKTNTPHTIDAGHMQFETGFFDYVHSRDRSHGADTTMDSLILGHVNFRLGVLNNLEVNLAIDNYDFLWSKDHVANQSVRRKGFGDIMVGGKLNLWGNEGGDDVWSTGLAIQPQLKVPTAQRDLGNKHSEFFVGLPFVVNLPMGFHLGVQTLASRERNLMNTRYVTGWQNSVSVDRVLFGMFDVYVEYWSHCSTELHQQLQQTVDIGFIYPLTDNVILDMGTVVGLNRAPNTFEALVGVSLRF
jgi:hypothetical protein